MEMTRGLGSCSRIGESPASINLGIEIDQIFASSVHACPIQQRIAGLAQDLAGLMDDVKRQVDGAVAVDQGDLIGRTPHRAIVNAAERALAQARHIYRSRRRREEIFNAELFSEPAWDMLLDLFIASCEGRQVSITSACIGANVPVATGLRWLQLLESNRLIERSADPADARRTWVSLTPAARRGMVRCLARSSEEEMSAGFHDTIAA